jgi:WD40 repeat protein
MRAVSASDDKTIKVWDIETGKELKTLIGHSESVSVINIIADDSIVVSVSQDKTIKYWSLETGMEMYSFYGDFGFSSCSITPDEKMIVAGDIVGNMYFLSIEGLKNKKFKY